MKNQMIYKCIPTTGEKNNSFVGIKANGDEIEVFYPESMQLSLDKGERTREIVLLLKSITLAKTKYGLSTHILETSNIGHTFPIDAYMWVLNDYSLNGICLNTEMVYRCNGSGGINWKRTIRQIPIISGGQFIYKNLVVAKNQQQDDIIAEIYKYCLRIASISIGWLIGIHYDGHGSIPFNKNLYESTIRKELEKTFDDKKRKRLNMMFSIISERSQSTEFPSSFSYGVNDYSYVYERMVDKLYGNVDDIGKYYPSAEWNLKCYDGVFKSTNLRPDTVINTRNGIYILDAKFYRFGTTMRKKDLPNSSAIQKQITYGEFIANTYNIAQVVNVFIMPYNKKNNTFGSESNIEFLGYAEARWKTKSNLYESVGLLLVDTKYLLQNWNKQEDVYRNELVNKLG